MFKEFKPEIIEKIVRTLESLGINSLKTPLELDKIKKFIEIKLKPEEFYTYVVRHFIQRSNCPELKGLLKFAQEFNLHLDDPNLEAKLRKEKKGNELESLWHEFAKLTQLKKINSLKTY